MERQREIGTPENKYPRPRIFDSRTTTVPIYFIQDIKGRVKIGYTDSVQHRLNTLQAAHVEPLFVMRIVPGYFAAERWYHKRFWHNRIVREWFDFDDEMMSATAPKDIENLLPPRFHGWKQLEPVGANSPEDFIRRFRAEQ